MRTRGLRFRERQAGEVSAAELTRVDLCWSVAGGLAMVDMIRGADFQTRHLLLALRAGEPTRVARALAIEGGFHAVGGPGSRRRAAKLFAEARALLARNPSEHVASLISGGECINAFQAGEWRRSLELARRADSEIRNQLTTATWEHDTIDFFSAVLAVLSRRAPRAGEQAPALLRAATARGDLYGATNLRVGLPNAAWLVTDDVTGARDASMKRRGNGRRAGFTCSTTTTCSARVSSISTPAAPRSALQAMRERWPAMRAAQILRISLIHDEVLHLRARLAIAAVGKARAIATRSFAMQCATPSAW